VVCRCEEEECERVELQKGRIQKKQFLENCLYSQRSMKSRNQLATFRCVRLTDISVEWNSVSFIVTDSEASTKLYMFRNHQGDIIHRSACWP
jgi:hypothetical protein